MLKTILTTLILLISVIANGQQVSDQMANQLAQMAQDTRPPFEASKDMQQMQEEAFQKLPPSLFPLSPDEIKTLRDLFVESKRAAAYTQAVPSRPTSSAIVVDFSPGATPPIIRLGAGYVTSLVFLDASGQPWPIKGYDIGNPAAFNIVQPTTANNKQGGNTLLIQSSTMFRQGNLAVLLQNLNTPIMITLLPGQQAVDYRVDIQVPRTGPMMQGVAVNGFSLPASVSPVLLDIINQLPPKDSISLKVQGAVAQAWRFNDRIYLRTPLTLISPGWTSKLSGADGAIHAYEITDSVSQIILLDNGEMKHATIEGL